MAPQKFIFILFAIITLSCNSNDNSLLKINPYSFEEHQIGLSDIADDLYYLPLDNYYPIGYISKIKMSKESILIYEPRYGLLYFDVTSRNGKKIGDFGRGPGEYSYLLSFAFDTISKHIFVLSSDKRIDIFSLRGKLLKSIPLKKLQGSFEEIEILNSKIILAEFINMGQARYNWVALDTSGTVLMQKNNSIPPFLTNSIGGGGLYNYNKRLCYWNLYSDTIYAISDDFKFRPVFLFDEGKFRLPMSYYNPDILSQYMVPHVIFETDKYLIFNYVLRNRITINLIDKNTRKSYISFIWIDMKSHSPAYTGGIKNDYDGGVDFIPKTYFVRGNNEYLVGIVDPAQLKKHINEVAFIKSNPKFPAKKAELVKFLDRIKDSDNPILCLVLLKK